MSKTNEHKQSYKNTLLGWLPEEWKLAKLGDVGRIRMCKRIFNHETSENGEIPFFKIGTFGKEPDAYISKELYEKYRSKYSFPKKGQILISAAGTLGKTVIYDGSPAYFQDSNIVWLDTDETQLTNEYLYYVYEIIKYDSEGGTIQRLYNDIINNAKFPQPPLHEQRRITTILSTWDEAINKTRQIIAQLQQRNKGLVQELLTSKKRLKGFEDEWKKLQIHEIAKEVVVRNKIGKDLTVLSCTKYDGLVPSLEYFGRRVFGSDTSTYKVVPQHHFAYATNHIEEGSIGYQDRFEEALISPMYTVFKTNEKVYDDYLYKLLKSHQYIHEYCKRMEGSIDRRGGLRWDEFSKIIVHLPELEEQKAIASLLTKANEEVKLYEQKLAALQQQKKGLMQKLLTGEVRVKI
ncbi:MAG: restriction endonuclease subunit S [Flavobacterium lindanitolerans]|uniref:restriction endonuclease subunit S n=1 Tax=Flavobacterium lindanitolerans TaxID=428988 RepID=UPI001A604B23|nr:restriction endonuclease subunit S [Flavobacterium lindanitolerans]MBL7867160.1 restriction endonuclease subunit S [Flavobacterium lindanitolerans]